MILIFILAILFTIGVSALCSILEAMILSTTGVEIESLKKRYPERGAKLERFKVDIEETSSAILSLNTIANTLGATIVGGLAVQIWSDNANVLFQVSLIMAMAILFISEIVPKNVGVLYRASLQPYLVFPLSWICTVMTPISKVIGVFVRFLIRRKETDAGNEEEIMFLAEKSEKEGHLTSNEREVISNALQLDEILVNAIMTPRTVVYNLAGEETIGELFNKTKNIPFARIPVYKDQPDNVTGVVRRRDILSAAAEDRHSEKVAGLQTEAIFIPDTATADDALQTFLKHNQQLAIAVDEFGSMSGVISMEDVVEHIIGQEIFEVDDPAVDMRELARRRLYAEKRRARRSEVKAG
ncbi:MAG: CNNM domain-containing protein [Opitutales bacterium]